MWNFCSAFLPVRTDVYKRQLLTHEQQLLAGVSHHVAKEGAQVCKLGLIVTAINVGGVVNFLLAAQQNSSLSSDVAQALAGSVEQIPLCLLYTSRCV